MVNIKKEATKLFNKCLDNHHYLAFLDPLRATPYEIMSFGFIHEQRGKFDRQNPIFTKCTWNMSRENNNDHVDEIAHQTVRRHSIDMQECSSWFCRKHQQHVSFL